MSETDNIKNAKRIKEDVEDINPDYDLDDREIYEDARKEYIGHFEDQQHPEGTPYLYDDAVPGAKPLKEG